MDLREISLAIERADARDLRRDDPATPPEHGRRIADGIPGARFELVADARTSRTSSSPRRSAS